MRWVNVKLALRMALEENSFEVDAFDDPVMEKGVYNLPILDIKMPKMHGFKIYRGLLTTIATRTRSTYMWCKPIVACCGPSKLH